LEVTLNEAKQMLKIFWFDGRMGRMNWWIVQVSLVIISLIFDGLFRQPFILPDLKGLTPPEMWQLVFDIVISNMFSSTPLLILELFLTWVFLTTSMQRLHDRGSDGWRIMFSFAPSFFIVLGAYQLSSSGLTFVNFVPLILGGVGSIVTLVWLIVECGILAGDIQANDYGEPEDADKMRAHLEKEMDDLRVKAGHPSRLIPVEQSEILSPQELVTGRVTFGKR
jgi:uncharacterized membrane protein YhaH (DUF805 family)